MNDRLTWRTCGAAWLGLGLLALGLSGCVCGPGRATRSGVDQPPPPTGFLFRTNYHGWSDALWLSNGKVEAIIVPSVGRVMQLRFAGEEDGVFWENPDLLGQAAHPEGSEWQNFGGDRVWPAPQVQWSDIAATNRPPPRGFDGTPYEARVDGWTVTLTSPVTPHYGIRVVREIELVAGQPTLRITTTFKKERGGSLETAIWVNTQLKHPRRLYARVPAGSGFVQGFNQMSERRAPLLELRDGLVSLERDPKVATKIGLESSTLVWLDDARVLRVTSPRLIEGRYPDGGASTHLATNPDPQPYVEMAMVGPLQQLRVGQETSQSVTYTLTRRAELDIALEALQLLPR